VRLQPGKGLDTPQSRHSRSHHYPGGDQDLSGRHRSASRGGQFPREAIGAVGQAARIRLGDYSSERCFFEFDPESGAYSRIRLPGPRQGPLGHIGIAQLLRTLGEGRVFVAKYLWRDDAWFSIGTQKWRLFDESLTIAHRETHGGFVCEFSVQRAGQCLRKLRYWRRDWFAMIIDSTYDWMDFSLANLLVDFVPLEHQPLQKQREDFIKLWTENAAKGQRL